MKFTRRLFWYCISSFISIFVVTACNNVANELQPCELNQLIDCTCPDGRASWSMCIGAYTFSPCYCDNGDTPTGNGVQEESLSSAAGAGGNNQQVIPQERPGFRFPGFSSSGDIPISDDTSQTEFPIQPATPPQQSPPDPQVLPVSTGCLLGGGGDYAAQGPYQVATINVEIPPYGMYTLFYPANLDGNCRHPIAAWRNGQSLGPGSYAHYHNHAASYGIVVAAAHASSDTPGNFVEVGIDFLIAQNNDPASLFYQKLRDRAGAAGHSQGVESASIATSHPNIHAEIAIQGVGTVSPGIAFLALSALNVGGSLTYESYNGGPAFLAEHADVNAIAASTSSGMNTPAGIQYVRLYTAWYRCWLGDDEAACSLFKPPCPLCGEPGWARIEGKNI